MRDIDVLALGELLIDFTSNGLSEQGNGLFEANPGGAPCNVLAILNKLGKKTAFVGKVGNDGFGRMLKKTLEDLAINTEGLLLDDVYHTTLALVHTDENGDRDFSFYRDPGADVMLTADEVDPELLKRAKIFHYGTLSMTHDGVRAATQKAIEIAKADGQLLSFDPNYREPLWKTADMAKEQISYGLSQCDILKISEEELELMTGTADIDEGVKILWEKHPNIKLFNVTAGGAGSYSFYKDMKVFQPGFKLGGTIETTGAGDTFGGAVLDYVLEHDIDALTEENLNEMLRFANAAAYLVTTRKGALRSMPEKEQIDEILANN